jgi:putative DNA primase/helicase
VNAEQLAKALGAIRSGRQWKCRCVAHEDRSPSMIIFDGHDSVQVRCMAGCEPQDIIAVLRARGLWHCEGSVHDIAPRHQPISHETDRREQMLRMLARCIFDDAIPIAGTLAQHYFESREIWSVAKEIDDIRFHPRCPREKSEQPAVVVAMRSIESRAITAVQRIFLDRHAKKLGKGMMLGACSGAAMQLQPKIGFRLHVCEGLETALSLIALDFQPTWALGSTSLIRTFPVVADIDQLVIFADADGPGRKAAGICGARWLSAGKKAKCWEPTTEGTDAADEWRSRCARL